MALRPDVSATHRTVKSAVVAAKKLELGKALSVRAIKDMASLMSCKPFDHHLKIEDWNTYGP